MTNLRSVPLTPSVINHVSLFWKVYAALLKDKKLRIYDLCTITQSSRAYVLEALKNDCFGKYKNLYFIRP